MLKKLLFLFFISIPFFSNASVLNRLLTLSVEDKELEQVLAIIEDKVDVSFAYKAKAIQSSRKVSIHVDKVTLGNVLKIILHEDKASFAAVGNQIIIFQQKPKVTTKTVTHKKYVYDTVWTQVIDKIKIIDTSFVKIYDTVVVNDTVKIEQATSFSSKIKANDNWYVPYINTSFSVLSVTSRLKGEYSPFINSPQVQSLITGFDITAGGEFNEKWRVEAGIGFHSSKSVTQLHNYSFSEFELLDTLEYSVERTDSSYIAVAGVDPIWIYKTDTVIEKRISKRIVSETDTVVLSEKKTINYVTVPIRFGFSHSINDRYRLICMSTLKMFIPVDQKKGLDVNYIEGGTIYYNKLAITPKWKEDSLHTL